MKIAVIGAGMGGMTAAARLARAGHSVTIYEASDTYGGKLRTEWIGKFAFDTGPSLFTLPAVYRDLFLKTGAAFEDEVDLQPVEPAFRYQFADNSTAVMPGVDPGMCAHALGDSLGGSSITDCHQ